MSNINPNFNFADLQYQSLMKRFVPEENHFYSPSLSEEDEKLALDVSDHYLALLQRKLAESAHKKLNLVFDVQCPLEIGQELVKIDTEIAVYRQLINAILDHRFSKIKDQLPTE